MAEAGTARSDRPTPASSRASPVSPPSPGCPWRRRWRTGTSASWASPSTAGPATGPGPASVRPPCGRRPRLLRPYHPAADALPFALAQVVDAGDIACTPFSTEEAVTQIQAGADALLAQGAHLVAVGGDHTIALPLLRATRPGTVRWPWCTSTPTSTPGTPISASATRTARPSGGPGRRASSCGTTACTWASAGRSTAGSDLTDDTAMGFAQVTTDEVAEDGVAAIVERMRARVGDAPVYVSVDIDVLDPAHAPGTGTPEAGGLTSRELLGLVRGLGAAARRRGPTWWRSRRPTTMRRSPRLRPPTCSTSW